MKAYCSMVMILFITILICLSNFIESQTDSCTSNLDVRGLPFETTKLHCVLAWSPHNFVLRYEQTTSNLWSFVLSTPDPNSYVAIGFSSDGFMVGSSAVAAWVSRNGTPTIERYHLEGQNPNKVVPGQGNLNLNSSMVVSQSSRLYLAFQLIFNPPTSRLLYAIGRQGFVPPATTHTLTEHQDKISTTLNYVTGETREEENEGRQDSGLRKGHGIMGMFGWGIMMIIGGIVARHMKGCLGDPVWFYAHVAVQTTGYLAGLIGVICGFVLEDRVGTDVSTHKAIGIFVLVLGSLQVMAILARPDKLSKVRKYWNWYHYSVGRILMIFAIANVFYGIHLAEEANSWNIGYGIILASLFVVSVILEAKMWMQK